MQKTKLGFGGNALLLAIGGLLCKIIGALYRIPLTNILGAEGMGAYQTIFPLFSILLTVSSGGITQAVSALISGSMENGQEERGILRAAFAEVIILSLSVGILMFACAPIFSTIQGSPSSEIGYKILSPVLIFSGLSSVFKGYYQAKSNVFPTFFANLIEQIFKLVLGLGLSIHLAPQGLVYALGGALFGTLLAELSSLTFLALRYAFSKEKPIKSPLQNPPNYDFFRVLRAVIPLSLGGLILPVTGLFDSVTVINILTVKSGNPSLATSLYGLLSGTVATLTNLPVVFTVALGVTIIPAISGEKNADFLTLKGRLSIKLGLFVCIPLSIIMLALALPIIDFLYPTLSSYERGVAAGLLAISAIGIPALGVTQIYSSLLFSVGLGSKTTGNLAIAAGVKCLLSPLLIYLLGINGAAVSTVICYFVSAFLNARTWRVIFGDSGYIIKCTALFSSISTMLAVPLFLLGNTVNMLILIGLSLLCMVLYLYISIKSGAFSSEEVKSLPFGSKITRLYQKE